MQPQPTLPAELDEVAALLCEAFKRPLDAAFVDRRLLRWKYFELADVWKRPCGYVLKQGAAITAHCAIAPLCLAVAHGPEGNGSANNLSGACLMDWAGNRRLPGAGTVLLRKLLTLTDVAVVAGGSEATRAVIPKLGFAVRDSIDLFARVVRPFRQSRTRPPTSAWKDAARLVRNTAWSISSRGVLSPGWNAVPVATFSELPQGSRYPFTTPEHSADYLNYWLRCPATRIQGFEIRRRGERYGHFLLSYVAGQTRIADLRVCSSEADDWQMAYRLATGTAADDETTCEVVCVGSTPLLRAAIAACGFRKRGNVPLFVYDPHGKLSGAPPLLWSLIDDDTAYLYDPGHPYTT